MRFLDNEKTVFLVFLFTFVVSIIGLRVNKSPLMDLFFATGGILMSVALARLYAKYELRFLNHLSPASYTIYLYHGIFQALSLQILMRFTHFDIGFYIIPQFRNIIPCEVLFYIEVTFWALSIDLGIFRSSWFLHRHKIPHPNQWGSMITTKKYSLFYEDFSVVGFICI